MSEDDDRHSWERPGAHEVAPGVHRIPLPLPGDALKAVNTYAISDGDGVVMIDGGWAMENATDLLVSALDSIGYRLADVREFFVTHVHRDHYTQAIAVRRITGAQVSLGEGEKAALDGFRTQTEPWNIATMHRAGALDLERQMRDWNPERELDMFEYPDHWLGDGVDLPLQTRALRVIATPGHTVGHVVFHDPQAATLYAGDHVLPHITPSISVENVRPESPLRDYLDSLRLVLAMPDSQLFPAHGPVTASTHARVEALLVHHDQRLTATADAVAGGASTGFEVANILRWTRREHRLVDLDMFNTMLAVNETVAHLDVLVERGWLTRSYSDGVAHYARA